MLDKNTLSIDKLYNYLPSFYQSNLESDKFVKFILDLYIEVQNLYKKEVQRVYNDLFLSRVEYYREIPLSVLTLSSSLYDLALVSQDFYQETGKSWLSSEATINDKIEYLLSKGLYEDLIYTTYDGKKCKVLSMNIYRDFSELLPPYVYFVDYVVYDNKLFLFNDLARTEQKTPEKTVLARDIIIESDKLSSKWGFMTGLERPSFISKSQYHNIIKGIIESFSDGAELSNLKNVIQYIVGSDSEVNLYDKYSNDISSTFKTLYDTNVLSGFDFIVEFPANFSASVVVNSFMLDVINIIKPAHTSFSMFLHSSTTYVESDVAADTLENSVGIETEVALTEDRVSSVNNHLILSSLSSVLNTNLLGITQKITESAVVNLLNPDDSLYMSYNI